MALVTLALVAVPRVAWACPVCANNDKGGHGVVIAIGVMIVFPFLVVFTVARVLRRAGNGPAGGDHDRLDPPT